MAKPRIQQIIQVKDVSLSEVIRASWHGSDLVLLLKSGKVVRLCDLRRPDESEEEVVLDFQDTQKSLDPFLVPQDPGMLSEVAGSSDAQELPFPVLTEPGTTDWEGQAPADSATCINPSDEAASQEPSDTFSPFAMAIPLVLAVGSLGRGVGNSSGEGTTDQGQTKDLFISGTVAAGVVTQGVEIAAFDGSGKQLGQKVSTDSQGRYTLTVSDLGDYRGLITVKAVDGNKGDPNYVNEATGNLVSMDVPLRGMKVNTTSKVIINITPLSEAAARIATGKAATSSLTDGSDAARTGTDVQSANDKINRFVADKYNGGNPVDIVGSAPHVVGTASFKEDPTTGKAVTDSDAIGKALAAWAGADIAPRSSTDTTAQGTDQTIQSFVRAIDDPTKLAKLTDQANAAFEQGNRNDAATLVPRTQAQAADALSKIKSFADAQNNGSPNGTGPTDGTPGGTTGTPAFSDYAAAGIKGVLSDDILGAVNAALRSDAIQAGQVSTPADIQKTVDAYKSILSAADEGAASPAVTPDLLKAVGVDPAKVPAAGSEAMNLLADVIDQAGKSAVDTPDELARLAVAAQLVQDIAALTPPAAATPAQLTALADALKALGVLAPDASPTSEQLAAVAAALAAAAPGDVNSLQAIEDLSTQAIAAIGKIGAYADGSAGNPSGSGDTLVGTQWDDLIVGGAGNDTLTGGLGADTFRAIQYEGGTDTVTDFNKEAGDKIDLRGLFKGTAMDGAVLWNADGTVDAGSLTALLTYVQVDVSTSSGSGSGSDITLKVDENGLSGFDAPGYQLLLQGANQSVNLAAMDLAALVNQRVILV